MKISSITTQIPATPLPREILFKSDNEAIEAFVCRDAQDEETKSILLETTSGATPTLSSTSLLDDAENCTTTNNSEEIVSYLSDSSPFGKFSNVNFEMKQNAENILKGLKQNSPDLSPETFFSEINGK
jgi:hypothetical protein